MPYAAGLAIAAAVWMLARSTGFDRDRSFYPTVLIVVAFYYWLFAAMGGSTQAFIVESIPIGVFVALAVAGFRGNLWLIVGGLAAHGTFDAFHGHLVHNPGVPVWWPAFCLAADVGLALGLAAGLASGRPTAVRSSNAR